MHFYFNANNKTQIDILRKAGIRNLFLSYKYTQEIPEDFTNIMINPGQGVDPFKYYDWLKKNEDKYTYALQYDDPRNIQANLTWYQQASMKVIPILHGNYMDALSKLDLDDGELVALGKLQGHIEEDESLKRLPSKYVYHGLGKGRWANRTIQSVDSSTWLSGARGRKTDVYKGEGILFGDKGRSNQSKIQQAFEKHKLFAEIVGLKVKDLLEGKYESLMKATLALYYLPMFHDLKCIDDNVRVL